VLTVTSLLLLVTCADDADDVFNDDVDDDVTTCFVAGDVRSVSSAPTSATSDAETSYSYRALRLNNNNNNYDNVYGAVIMT